VHKTNILLLAKTNRKLENPGLVSFYDITPRNGAGLFLQTGRLAEGSTTQRLYTSKTRKTKH